MAWEKQKAPRAARRLRLSHGVVNRDRAPDRTLIERRRQALVITSLFTHAQRLSQGFSTTAVGNSSGPRRLHGATPGLGVEFETDLLVVAVHRHGAQQARAQRLSERPACTASRDRRPATGTRRPVCAGAAAPGDRRHRPACRYGYGRDSRAGTRCPRDTCCIARVGDITRMIVFCSTHAPSLFAAKPQAGTMVAQHRPAVRPQGIGETPDHACA